MIRFIIAAAMLLMTLGAARAAPCVEVDIMRPCYMQSTFGVRSPARSDRVVRQRAVARPKQPRQAGAMADLPTIVGHPAGCPRVAFCGCGAAVRVFGAPRRDLWLAAAWLRFPRAAPAPGMVAARHGHVFVLESEIGSGQWQVYDANSGGHQTRIHARSLSGYTVVNPHG